jgi:hypothetical protein
MRRDKVDPILLIEVCIIILEAILIGIKEGNPASIILFQVIIQDFIACGILKIDGIVILECGVIGDLIVL